ncbi:MAG: hypothetical protein ACOCYU_06070 [Brevefilum sp.]
MSLLFLLKFPIKITGNLLLLTHAPLWIYRVSRLVNIFSFFLSAWFCLYLILTSLSYKTINRRSWWIASIAFFVLLFMVGLLVYQDYGVSYDEPNERTSGLVSAHFVASYIEEVLLEPDPYIPKLSNYRYRYYGVAYQLPLTLIENNTLTREQDIWHLRHLSNFLFFYLGVVAFFHLTADFFRDSRFGLLGAMILVMSPRLFAHAFFNPKDTVFLAAFTIAFYFSARFWRMKTFWGAVLAGITCAYAANIRVIALALVIITLGILLLDLLSKKNRAGWQQTLIYMAVFAVFLILFWPAAWQSPLTTLGKAISLFSDYTYWNSRIMYLGEFIYGAQPPWHYLPVWMGITIPLPYILFFLIGLVSFSVDFVQKRQFILREYYVRMQVILLGLFFAPPLLAIFLGSTLYNGWRHFQFIYPVFLMIALLGLRDIISIIDPGALKQPGKILTLLILALSAIPILLTGFWMVHNHPHQAVYFNRIGHLLGRENFERDYWRISVKDGLEYLLARDSTQEINICMESHFEDPSYLMVLPDEMRSRMHVVTDPVDYGACDYAVNTYRRPDAFECEELFHEIKVEGLPILTITACQTP